MISKSGKCPNCLNFRRGHWEMQYKSEKERIHLKFFYECRMKIKVEMQRLKQEKRKNSAKSFREVRMKEKMRWGLNQGNKLCLPCSTKQELINQFLASKETGVIGDEGEILLNFPEINHRFQWLEPNNLWFFRKCSHFRMGKETNTDKYQLCSICLASYQITNNVTLLYCGHSYHTACLEKWLIINPLCPYCKQDFREHAEFTHFDKYYKKRIRSSPRRGNRHLYDELID